VEWVRNDGLLEASEEKPRTYKREKEAIFQGRKVRGKSRAC